MLRVSSLTLLDAGRYRCVANNTAMSESKESVLSVSRKFTQMTAAYF